MVRRYLWQNNDSLITRMLDQIITSGPALVNAKYTQSFIRAIQLEIARAISIAVVHFSLWRVVSIRFGLAIPAMAEEASAPYVSIRSKR